MNTKIIIACVSLALMLNACGGEKSSTSEVQPPASNKDTRLKRSISSDDLETSIKKLMLNTYGKIAPPIITYSTTESGVADTKVSFSTTNTQEASVDEADRLKNDASYLYVASSKEPSINIFSIQNEEAVLSSTTTITNNSSQSISGLYLSNKKLTALSGNNSYFGNQWFEPIFWNDRSTTLDFFTTQNGQLDKINNLKVDGQLISSRRIGNTLYLTTRHTPSLKDLINHPSTEQEVSKNRALIESASLSDFLPNYSLDDENKGDILSSSSCFMTNYTESENQQASIINILSIDLNNTNAKPKGTCFIGAAEALYVSSESLYLATTQYNYNVTNNIAKYSPNITTDIHKFSLDSSSVAYKGSAQVEGHLGWKQDAKSFRMGEYEDALRIITYTGDSVSSNPSPAKLFILKEDSNNSDKLKIIATLPNDKRDAKLGKSGEQIYATRFLGNKAYLVTFRTTDPLYILDLSDPTDPFIAGELEINGYSDYLHPVSENLVLGIGKDAIPAISESNPAAFRGAWYQGVKISLIDVSDPKSPIYRSQALIGKRGTETAVSYNHHAFTSLLQENGDLRIALPISVHDNKEFSENDTVSTYHKWQYDALHYYNINTFTGNISKGELIKANNSQSNKFSSDWQNDRSTIIGDKVYYLHGDDIISSDWKQ